MKRETASTGYLKRNVALIAAAIAVLSGCASHPTRDELSKVTFGSSLEQVRETLKLSHADFRPGFRVNTTNGVLEMFPVFCAQAGGEWRLLFQDGRFFSASASQQHNQDWPGFSNPQDPEFNELAWFWKDFVPPIEPHALLPLHTNVVYDASAVGQAENIAWGIYLFPIALPLYVLHLVTNNEADIAPHLTIQLGMTEAQVGNLLRCPGRQVGNERRSVYWFSLVDVSVGFDEGRVVFVFYNGNVSPPESGINRKSEGD